jgi:hypothetical protein
MTIINPPEVRIPESLQATPESGFYQSQATVLYQLWDALRKLGTPTSTIINQNSMVRAICLTVDGGGSVPAIGQKGYITIPYSGTIQAWALVSDQIGSVQVDIGRGINGPSIVQPGSFPKLVNSQSGNAAITDWFSTSITAGDILEFYLDSISTITRFNLVLKVLAT